MPSIVDIIHFYCHNCSNQCSCETWCPPVEAAVFSKINNEEWLDEYLDSEKSYQRLKTEFEKHHKLIIAYDVDSTVYDYHHTGAKYEMVKYLLRLYKDYAYFIVFTSSESDRYDDIKAILDNEDLPYDSINEDAPFIPFKGRKVYYNIMLDDRAGLRQTYLELMRLYSEVILPSQNES